VQKFPVAEVFGPTIQGEGPDAGTPAYFIRFGGCDFRCSWCDSMHAVEPAQVRQLEKLTADEIAERLSALPGGPRLVVLSGGNPALHHLGPLVKLLNTDLDMRVSVETQGSVWRDWLYQVDRLVVSPKPPSSDMATLKHARQLRAFLDHVYDEFAAPSTCLKIVVFDEEDLKWARHVAAEWPHLPLWLSVGTPQHQPPYEDGGIPAEPITDDQVIESIRMRYEWLCNQVARDSGLCDAKVLPQLHVIAWGTKLGV
jgi:7-carboxy-7-deazaguanine synthase